MVTAVARWLEEEVGQALFDWRIADLHVGAASIVGEALIARDIRRGEVLLEAPRDNTFAVDKRIREDALQASKRAVIHSAIVVELALAYDRQASFIVGGQHVSLGAFRAGIVVGIVVEAVDDDAPLSVVVELRVHVADFASLIIRRISEAARDCSNGQAGAVEINEALFD